MSYNRLDNKDAHMIDLQQKKIDAILLDGLFRKFNIVTLKDMTSFDEPNPKKVYLLKKKEENIQKKQEQQRNDKLRIEQELEEQNRKIKEEKKAALVERLRQGKLKAKQERERLINDNYKELEPQNLISQQIENQDVFSEEDNQTDTLEEKEIPNDFIFTVAVIIISVIILMLIKWIVL